MDCIWSTFRSLGFNTQFNFYIKCVFLLEIFELAGSERVDGIGVLFFFLSFFFLFFWGGFAIFSISLIVYPVKKSAFLSFLELLFVNSWDEWVGTDRLLKHTEENVQKQKALKERLEMERKTKAVQAPQMKPKNSGG